MKKDVFCLAPWVHSHINLSGKRALCCFAKSFEGLEELPLEDFWNSDLMKESRLRMINGNPDSSICASCVGMDVSTESPRLRFKNDDLVESLLENTKADGSYDGTPSFFDYRISNICNLSCRMCGAEASSKIEAATKKLASTPNSVLLEIENKKKQNINKIKPEIIKSIRSGSVKEIYWASGEAFLQKDHWDIIDECINTNQASQISLCYNSNLSFKNLQFKKWIERLNHFKDIEIGVSLDGVGRTVEFIRDGCSWNSIVSNLEYCLGQTDFRINLAITLTIPTLLNIEELFKFLYFYRLNYNVSICLSEGVSSLYSPLSLPMDVRSKLLQRAIKVIDEKYSSSEYLLKFKEFLIEILNYEGENDCKKTSLDNLNRAIELDAFFDRESVISYYSKFPVLKEWLEDMKVKG